MRFKVPMVDDDFPQSHSRNFEFLQEINVYCKKARKDPV